ncbi:AMIN-like domain-containing (lipo)protein [Solwaraspora sp. WMMB335]|uniref:AMIN-like domain-containing (lipo)protein n=1 Tax=Solwaraspora sp. WMMB335 TaxID=3404118 RepID=UPI003B943861
MTRLRVPLICCLAVLLVVAGCVSSTPSQPNPGSPAPARTTGTPALPAIVDAGYRLRYGWAVPVGAVSIEHEVRPPAAPPPQPPLPYLVEISTADHPEADPAFSRISFGFRSGFPGYRVSYVPQVVFAGSGEPLDLPGNCFLQVRFVRAQAHDEYGRVSVQRSPDPDLGYLYLRGYGFAGDFEGQVTYGLGVQTAAGPDQVLPLRIGESTRDGLHLIVVDLGYG